MVFFEVNCVMSPKLAERKKKEKKKKKKKKTTLVKIHVYGMHKFSTKIYHRCNVGSCN